MLKFPEPDPPRVVTVPLLMVTVVVLAAKEAPSAAAP